MNKKHFYNLMKPIADSARKWLKKYGKEELKNARIVCTICRAEFPLDNFPKDHVCNPTLNS